MSSLRIIIPSASVGRRNSLKAIAATAAAVFAPAVHARTEAGFEGGNAEDTPGFWERPRWVWLRRAQSGEQLRLVYWRDGQILDEAHQQISWLLRDLRFERMLSDGSPLIGRALDQGRIRQEHLSPWVMMDPTMIDVLYAYSAWLHNFGMGRAIEATSGFRHVITNDMTEGAARGSEHTRGRAADITVPGVGVTSLARLGVYLRGGGVGVYQARNFLHIDSGRVRSWAG